jgi:hypothetical protein
MLIASYTSISAQSYVYLYAITDLQAGRLDKAKKDVDVIWNNEKYKNDVGAWYAAARTYYAIGEASKDPDSKFRLLDTNWLKKGQEAADYCRKIDSNRTWELSLNELQHIKNNNGNNTMVTKPGLKAYKGNFPMVGIKQLVKKYTGEVEYYYRDAPNGERIYEDTFSFKYNNNRIGDSYYYYVSGRFKNDIQVGTWHFNENGFEITITFNDEGIPCGDFNVNNEYVGQFEDGHLKELKCSKAWGYYNEHGKANGKWVIRTPKSPVSTVVFRNGVCPEPYYFERATGDKTSIPEWVLNIPRNERVYAYNYLRNCLFRSTPKWYFEIKY